MIIHPFKEHILDDDLEILGSLIPTPFPPSMH